MFEVTDAAFGPGAQFDVAAEGLSVFTGEAFLRWFALAGDHPLVDTEVDELLVDLGFTVATVGCDSSRCTTSPLFDPLDRRGQLRRIRRIALLHSVIQDDAVIVVHHLGLVPEFDRFAEPSLRDRAGIAVVRAEPPCRPIGSDPGDALPGLRNDLVGRVEQFGQIVDRSGRPAPPPTGYRVTDNAFAQRIGLGGSPPRRPFGVDQQPLSLIDGGGGQLPAHPRHHRPGLIAHVPAERKRFCSLVRGAPPASMIRLAVRP